MVVISRYSIRTALIVTGLANGPFWFRCCVTQMVSPSSLKEYVMNAPGPIAAGFLAAIGRIVITLPGHFVRAGFANERTPHRPQLVGGRLGGSGCIGRGLSAWTSTRL